MILISRIYQGVLYTPIARLSRASINVALRKDMDVFASISLIKNSPGNWPTRHKNVDLAIIRENTEGEYSGLEHSVGYYSWVIQAEEIGF